MENAMSPTQSTDREALTRLIEEGRKRGYVRRAELEAIFRRLVPDGVVTDRPRARGRGDERGDEPGDENTPDIDEMNDLDAAIEQLLAADVDIVDDEEEEAR